MNDLIVSHLNKYEEAVRVATPAGHQRAIEWVGSMAIEYTVRSFIDDQFYNDGRGMEREQHRAGLGHIMAWAMDCGLPEIVVTRDDGLINEAITKQLQSVFKKKAYSTEVMEMLVECGENEQTLNDLLEAENLKNERIFHARQNKLVDLEQHIRHMLVEWLHEAMRTESHLEGISPRLIGTVASKFGYALNMRRKYCIRGISMGNRDVAGELAMVNAVVKEGHERFILDRIDELDRQSDFQDDPTLLNERGRVGDNERPDITY